MASLGVLRWHAEGYLGRGVKIAVLDSGFRGYRNYLGSALPARLRTRSFRNDGNLEAKDSQHGILCGEVLHALAPQADLLFANWEPDRPDRFLDAVRWARVEGARIISCSVIMPSWSDGNGGGSFDDALDKILGSGARNNDLLCFASAGNTAHRHWSGIAHAGPDGWLEWQPGLTVNPIFAWGSDIVSVELYGPPGARYDLQVLDERTATPVGHVKRGSDASRSWTVARFQPRANAYYGLRVRLRGGQLTPFHVAVLGGTLGSSTTAGSVCCPADAPGVIAVGAVAADGQRLDYSSCGPNSGHPKPDLVAPVPFPSLCRGRPFAGTSAAAPQAAALAALCWSRHPDWTAEQISSALRRAAHDLGPPGPDFETGYGLISMPGPDLAPTIRLSAK
jgi:subtilisin family serine protease